MNLTFREDYWDDPKLKKRFIDFLIHIHRLDLSLRDQMGYWDNLHRPFSFFEGDKLVASLCIYSMDMMVGGRRCRVAQFSGVGTLEEYRRMGLNRQLTEKALIWARPNHDFFFLFADTDAYPFYEKCGFRRTLEQRERIGIKGQKMIPGAEKLDTQRQDHRDLIYRIASERAPVSMQLGVYTPKLFMFWCLYFLKENIYFIAERDLLVLHERKDGVLTIFDVVGKNVPPFDVIYPYIAGETDEFVEFEFMTDRMNLGRTGKFVAVETNGTHLMGDFPLETDNFLFPLTAHA